MAGNGAVDATAALQDFDGISYTKGSSILRQVNASLGDEVFFAGVKDHFERHRFGNATMHDLFASWEKAGGGDLTSVTDNWLLTAGPDALRFDRSAGVVRRTPPAAHPADRSHTMQVAVAAPGGPWRVSSLTTTGAETRLAADAGRGGGDRPVRGHVGGRRARRDHADGAGRTAACDRERHGPGRHLERDPQRVPQRATRSHHRIDLVEAAMPVEDNDDALTGSSRGRASIPRPSLPTARRRWVVCSAPAGHASTRPSRARRCSCRRSERDQTATDADRLRAWRDGTTSPPVSRSTST